MCLCACQQKVQWQQQKSVRSSLLRRNCCMLLQLNLISWGVGVGGGAEVEVSITFNKGETFRLHGETCVSDISKEQL